MAVPLDSYLQDWSDKDDLIITDTWRYHGKTYALPYAINITGIAYWEDVLQNAGVTAPQTWDELLEAGRDLTVYGNKSGVLERGGIGTWNNPKYDGIYPLGVLVEQLGSSLYSEDLTKPNFNTEEGRRALNYLRDLYQVAYPNGAKPASRIFDKGTGIHFWFSNWHTPSLHKSYSRDELKKFRLKRIPGPTGPKDSIAIASGWGWMINPDSAHKKAAWTVMTAFLNDEVQKEFLGAFAPGGLLSPRKSFEYPRDWPFVKDALAMARPPLTSWGPVHPFFKDVLDATQDLIYDAASGKRAIAGTLEEADRLVGNIFKEKFQQ